jgi:hypothetical protein
MMMGSDVSWNIHEDHGIPREAMTNAPAQSTDEDVLERTVPDDIETQQKSAETAESPSALAAACYHHPPSFSSDTSRECRPSCHDHDR